MSDTPQHIDGEDESHGHGVGGPMYKLVIGAVGIVFGDIGTSPIYAFRETFMGHHKLAVDQAHIYGVLSLIFWSMMIVVTIKYVSIIMRADNKGEGGSLALLALINSKSEGARWTAPIVLLGVFATALFYGDSMITPAMSVLSASEGLEVVNPAFGSWVVPISVGILVGLFSIQSRGTALVGAFFGPIMIIYFAVIATLGVHFGWCKGISCSRFGRPCDYGRRGALRRYGAFRPQTNSDFVALFCDARTYAQLSGAGGNDRVLAERD
jgi:KUP system potassium uptake protein